MCISYLHFPVQRLSDHCLWVINKIGSIAFTEFRMRLRFIEFFSWCFHQNKSILQLLGNMTECTENALYFPMWKYDWTEMEWTANNFTIYRNRCNLIKARILLFQFFICLKLKRKYTSLDHSCLNLKVYDIVVIFTKFTFCAAITTCGWPLRFRKKMADESSKWVVVYLEKVNFLRNNEEIYLEYSHN